MMVPKLGTSLVGLQAQLHLFSYSKVEDLEDENLTQLKKKILYG